MDEHPHALFFEARELTDREREKIWKHFNKRRDSGGGDCAAIQKVGDGVYKVCFRGKEDQERVLQRKFHNLSLPDGELRLTVTRTPGVQTPVTRTSPPGRAQKFQKANSKSLEKTIEMDIFLLYYLRDSPKALKVLEKQLSSIGCSVALDLSREEAVVRGDAGEGPGGGFGGAEAWETQVDRIFSSLSERYLCHHLVEPHAVKRAVEELRSPTEAVQVYADSGYAVVVGEPEEVMARIRSLPVRRELPVAQRKLGLVEAELKRECPGVQANVRPGVIVLEGPEAEVQAAEAKLQHLLGSIEERSVQLPEGVLGFLERSSATARYQARFGRSLPGPVSLEVGGGSLLLASSSPEALRQAEATLRAELSQAEVRLHGDAGVSPNLDRVKELLRAAGDQANIPEPGVEVRFLPGATTVTVRLSGMTPQVNRLRDLLDDHLANQASAREELDLPRPEMASCFQQLLDLMGTRPGGVTLETYGAPRPKVVVSGPRRRVQEARRALAAAMAAVAVETVVLDGPGARRHFRGDGKVNKELVERSCRVLIREQPDANAPGGRTSSGPPTDTAPPQPGATEQRNEVHLNIKLGSLEDEQVNVLVLPMLNKQLDATKVGKDLLTKGGAALRFKFAAAAAERPVAPGDVLQVDGPPTLGCSRILLIECVPWDGVRGGSLRALSRGLKTCFDLCVQRDFCSVAVPVIGPGPVLKYPLTEAAQALGDAVRQFGASPSSGCLSAIHVVVKPGYPDSEECYYEVHKQLSSNLNQAGPVVFRSLATDVDQISMVIGGGVRLHVVFGDITNETTDAVVNTTDFVNFEKDGVCKDILTIAGPEVEAELRAASVGRGEVFVSHPGGFPCAAIFHVSGKRDPGLIEGLVLKVLDHCESFEFSSVAIPAICAGSGRLAPGAVASAVLGGVRLATSLGPTRCLTDIRLVLLKADVFLAFKEEATQMFLAQKRRGDRCVDSPAGSDPPACAGPPPTGQQSAFLVLGLRREDVEDAAQKLRSLYRAQCSSQTFGKEQLESLSREDLEDLHRSVIQEGVHLHRDPSGGLTLSGPNEAVNRVIVRVSATLHGTLRRELRARQEEDLFPRVAWCILGQKGRWERLPKASNYKLEQGELARGVVDARGVCWHADLQAMRATAPASGQTAELKRLQNLPDFTLPLYWDSMSPGEFTKVVGLPSSSAEYQTIKEGFSRTVSKTIIKIERLQNVHLRQAYEAKKKHISDKNAQEGFGAGEKLLYHGTSQDNCDSIMKTGFNRSFAGQNATSYGIGSYFAVCASYSAQTSYSRPMADGAQLMFVARVLTGVCARGNSSMRVPPPRQKHRPHERFDSVVDREDRPNLYVVFHDNQAYPDYLITFR